MWAYYPVCRPTSPRRARIAKFPCFWQVQALSFLWYHKKLFPACVRQEWREREREERGYFFNQHWSIIDGQLNDFSGSLRVLEVGTGHPNRLSGSKIRLFRDRSISISSTGHCSQLAAREIIKYEKLPVNTSEQWPPLKNFSLNLSPLKSQQKAGQVFLQAFNYAGLGCVINFYVNPNWPSEWAKNSQPRSSSCQTTSGWGEFLNQFRSVALREVEAETQAAV